MNFASDNTAGIAPEILQALAAGNDGFAMGYGNDDITRAVERRIGEIFERDVAVFLVPTGTAANALALAHISPPWGAVFAHAEAHILTDECGAPEFFGAGLKLVGMPGIGCKVTPDTLAETVSHYEGHTPHEVIPSAFSFAQASEAGTIYRPEEIAVLAKLARAHGMKVHMDGARFANALVRTNASPAEVTWRAGVDVLSFGATKGGALAAEAVVFFDRALAANMAERRKRAGHLVSKHRYLALQFAAFLKDDYWLRLARHANGMADRLAAGLTAAGHPPAWPVEANLVFLVVSKAVEARLKAAGARYYVRRSESLAAPLQPDQCLIRLVASFATRADEIDQFLKLILELAAKAQ
jgi:threonine aldolase